MNWQIEQMVQQLGGTGFRGALGYIGASKLSFRHRPDNGTPDASTFDDKTGAITFETGLSFKPNTKANTRIIVTLEPSDTYIIRFVKLYPPSTLARTGKGSKMIKVIGDVYAEDLQHLVEQTYDEYIKEFQNGFIEI